MIEQQTNFCYFGEYITHVGKTSIISASVVEGTLISQKLQECILKSKTHEFLLFKMPPLGVFSLTMILDTY
jgi:hypothetical protein